MIQLINGVKCTQREAAFINYCLFDNFKKHGNSAQDKQYVQHLKEVCNELDNE